MLDCQRWEEVRKVATSLCSIFKDGKKYDFVANSLCWIVKDGRKYDLLPPVCARLSKIGRSTVCCHQLAVLDCQRCEKVRFVATSLRCSIVKDGKKYDLLPPLCAPFSKMGRSRFVATSLRSIVKDGKKYDLLPPVCARRWEEVRFVQFVLKDGKKYDLLPPVCSARLSKMGRSSICCHQFVLDCQRWEEVR